MFFYFNFFVSSFSTEMEATEISVSLYVDPLANPLRIFFFVLLLSTVHDKLSELSPSVDT